MSVMRDIPINNSYVKKALDNFLWYYDNREIVQKSLRLSGVKDDRDYYVGDEYRDHIISLGTKHDGYPDHGRSYALKADRIEDITTDPKIISDYIKRYNEYNEELCSILCTRNNALTQMYPPKGFISWHNNANACAYNLIFSWSETGDGYFKYVDGDTGEDVIVQDRKGWQCKAGYFGAYNEHQSKLVYHTATTECWRITVSYMFDHSDMAQNIQKEAIDEIMFDL